MGYRKIPNLHRDRTILDHFKEVYAMEKIHGTSAHVGYRRERGVKDGVPFDNSDLFFFPGGVKLEAFTSLFDYQDLLDKFIDIGHDEITVYGEAYGGKCQKMSKVYGDELRFIAFEVKIGESWLDVEKAENVATKLGLEFVHWVRGPATEEFVNKQRDAPSELAIRRGMGDNHTREGIVVRPTIEVRSNNGRLLAKHKHKDFSETKTPTPIDPSKQKRLSAAIEVAEQYVVPMRIEHVLDKLLATKRVDDPSYEITMGDTGEVIRRTIADVKVEEGNMIDWSKDVEKAIGREARRIFHEKMTVL